MSKFSYIEPQNINEVCSLLKKYKSEAGVLAGGTDLLVDIRNGEINPRYVISLHKIDILKGITVFPEGGVRIGALATLSEISSHPFIISRYRALAEAASVIGSIQVQNIATIGGNICNASPAADTAPPLLLFESKVNVAGISKKRTIPIDKFFLGPGKTALKNDEIVESIYLSPIHERAESCYLKIGRTRGVDLAIVGVGCLVSGERLTRLSFASVAPTPLRVMNAEEILSEDPFEKTNIEKAAQIVKNTIQPISDLRSSREYRNAMALVLMKRALETVKTRLYSKKV